MAVDRIAAILNLFKRENLPPKIEIYLRVHSNVLFPAIKIKKHR